MYSVTAALRWWFRLRSDEVTTTERMVSACTAHRLSGSVLFGIR
ncbi:hypothetical protein HanHA300_Chr06g0222111 [Helianthus annuus]|nr:hypothetical protein HanHA300_Chr06g0222111 [Helianthus annuus]KAJ0574418.1 hypothetical protein HanHA89_Chr06g0237941 [Helianthus annuus]KAJ0738755.1 hypothetical protein HanLR1_Chr06g0221901 [Helianthus annuus]